MKAAILFLSLFAMYASGSVRAQNPSQYRGIWVDTFNTPLNTHEDVLAVVRGVQLANCNAIFAQARRRGDSWYLNSLEPPADRTPIAPGFDPLADLIREAHAVGIEVHAFVIIGALWNNDPAIRIPETPEHIFNKHGVNPVTGKVFEGRDNWLTRTLLPNGGGVSFGGYRLGAAANTGDFWIDLGHPDAAEHTLRTLLRLIRSYELDGLHLDRIRYPDIPGPQTGGVSSGYNETNLARFHKRFGHSPGSAPPAATDPRWGQWRREQVTDFVRRVYLNAIALKPKLKISAALIAYGSAPASDAEWKNAEPYFRVYQDWRAWIEEGILDFAVLMNYKREHLPIQRAQYDSWVEWSKNHAYDRGILIGEGVYLNGIEGTLRQTRRALTPSPSGASVSGVAFFSYAITNEALASNPFSIPAGRRTPRHPFPEFVSALMTGKSVDGAPYESPTVGAPVFSAKATIPDAPWKSNPKVGHLMGTVRSRDGSAVDYGDVRIDRVFDGTTSGKGRTAVATHTDGNGFYGGVDLAPGNYRVSIAPRGEPERTINCPVLVSIGRVSVLDLTLDHSQLIAASTADGGGCGPEPTPEPATIARTSPISIFTANGDETGVPAALFLKIRAGGGQTYAPVADYNESQNAYVTRALDLGPDTDQSFLILFGSGLRERSAQLPVQAKVGGVPADVLFAGEQGAVAGLDQMNIRLPNSLRGRGEVDVIIYAGKTVAKVVRIRLK